MLDGPCQDSEAVGFRMAALINLPALWCIADPGSAELPSYGIGALKLPSQVG